MCGIAGFIKQGNFPIDWEEVLTTMANQIIHRGPDSGGIWYDVNAGVGLAHRRLAILDLTQEGHQPMFSESGRYAIVFNGEIYNYQDLMNELVTLGHKFRGRSDTEVILASIEQWGIKDALSRFIGMFAFALWNIQTKNLYLARDRLGEKPLYYGDIGKVFAFSSELKVLRVHPHWEGRIDNDALAMYMRYGYIPTPHSIYQGINKLTPGAILKIDFSRAKPETREELYWSLDEVACKGEANPLPGSEDEMISGLENLLMDSIKQQMIADVPVGAFLSGGIDSSLVVALMQSISSLPVETFSIGFEYAGYNEANYAKAIANYLGTKHTELYVTAEDAINVIPKLRQIYDEPFADSSQIPTYLVSELARRYVTVSLSGDAGDELFCGYSRYFLVKNMWGKIALLPYSLRRWIAYLLMQTSAERLDSLFKWLNPLFSKYGQAGCAGDKLKKAAYPLCAADPHQFYSMLTANWNGTEGLLLAEDFKHSTDSASRAMELISSSSFVSQMMFMDIMGYLPDDILVKLDRASMANSLESRVPLLDYRIVEYAWRLPMSVKYKNGQGKWVLRQVLKKYVPKKFFERPKMGFGAPIGTWLTGLLREWAEALLDENRLKQQGYINSAVIRKKWQEHLQGTRNWQYQLWIVLVFQLWLDNQ
jgi:asparagine synthase (glutamine-hydrolysing)